MKRDTTRSKYDITDEPVDSSSSFSDLGICPALLRSIRRDLEYEHPTPIQK